MWSILTGWVSSLVRFLAPQKADFELLTKMYQDLVAKLQEQAEKARKDFIEQIAMLRLEADSDYKKQTVRINKLEGQEEECRKRLALAEHNNAVLDAKMVGLQEELARLKRSLKEMSKIKNIREDPEFQRRTLEQDNLLLRERHLHNADKEGPTEKNSESPSG